MALVQTHLEKLDCLKEIDIKKVEFLAYLIKNTKGNVFIIGVGKNSTLAKHIADTLKSISIKAFFFSPLNCTHGDIGALCSDDLVIFLSKSGNTDELNNIVNQIKNKNIKTVLVSCNQLSLISKKVNYNIYLNFSNESTFMIPTTSIILYIFFFNLVVNVLVYKTNLSIEQYGLNHQSGQIGFLINNKISDIMEKENLPIISENIKIIDVIFKMTEKQYPLILYVNNKTLIGIFTDGDLRRCITEKKENLDDMIENFINKKFFHLRDNILLSELDIDYLIKEKLLSGIPILNSRKELVGIINKEILLKNNFTL
jgi:arabinose-5-phosphate isomerase